MPHWKFFGACNKLTFSYLLQEDHVSMGGFAARKALEVVEHVEIVLAIELLAACQGLEFHRPLKTTPALEVVFQQGHSMS